MKWPKIPLGSKRLRQWADEQLRQYIDSRSPVSGIGTMIHQGPKGTAVNVVPGGQGGLPPYIMEPGAYALFYSVSDGGVLKPAYWVKQGGCPT